MVPWGKHNPSYWRGHHTTPWMDQNEAIERFMVVVIVKDPFFWMESMCRHHWEMQLMYWDGEGRKEHATCPSLVFADEIDYSDLKHLKLKHYDNIDDGIRDRNIRTNLATMKYQAVFQKDENGTETDIRHFPKGEEVREGGTVID